MDTNGLFDKIQDLIAEAQTAGLDHDGIISALEMCLDVQRDAQAEEEAEG